MKKTILVVDSDPDMRELITYNLRTYGIDVLTAHNSDTAYTLALTLHLDLILIEVILPVQSGFDLCRRLRNNPATASIPIVFLTYSTSEIDQIIGLELGAEDYIEKTISPRVIIARIKTIFRRLQDKTETTPLLSPELITFNSVQINPLNYKIYIEGKEVSFPKKEFELLTFLARNPGRVFSRDFLLRQIWQESANVIDRTVDVHISKIRIKLGKSRPCIKTVKGVGYSFSI